MNIGFGINRKKLLKKSFAIMALVCLPGVALAADNGKVAPLKVSLLGYAEYDVGQTGTPGDGHTSYNKFNLTRGYVTITKGITPWLSGRVTTDVYQDNSPGNSSNGSWNIRLKYLYGQINIPSLAFLTNMKSEVGQGHTPWLDFEESVNTLRAQGPMITDLGGIQTSADIGVDILGYFGGKLKDASARVGNTHYDGRYGSWHIGVYNGSGYHDSEANQNKVAEARVTVRPLPDVLPGLQFSYMGAFGKGNTKPGPDYDLNQGMVSFQNPDFILYGLYFHSKGNYKGTLVDTAGAPLIATGYSFFGKYNLPVLEHKLAVFGRYDHVNDDDDHVVVSDADYSMYVGGLAYKIFKGNQVLVDYEQVSYGTNSGGIGKVPVAANNLGNDHRVQFVYQFEF
jgi:hypothetical protein